MRLFAFFCLLPLLLAGCSDVTPGPRVLRVTHQLDTVHPNHRGHEEFARVLEQISGGRMKAKLYPGAQLGTARESIELLQIGSLDMTSVAAADVESFVPEVKIFSLPYLFRDNAHMRRVLASPTGRTLLEAGLGARLRGLGYFDSGSRSFYTKDKPVESPGDLAGKKVRVLNSPMAMEGIRALGGAATPIAYGELYTALQQGVVDAAENNPTSYLTSRHYEIAKFYSLDEHTAIPDMVLISEVTWNRLSAQEREWVTEAVRAGANRQMELWTETEQKSLATLAAAGVTIARPDKALFMDRVGPIYDRLQQVSPELHSLVEDIRSQ